MTRTFGQSAPREKPPAITASANTPTAAVAAPAFIPRLRPNRFGIVAWAASAVLALFWIGVGVAFLWGYFGPQGLAALDPARKALAVAGVLLPPCLILAMAAALARSAAMSDATR